MRKIPGMDAREATEGGAGHDGEQLTRRAWLGAAAAAASAGAVFMIPTRASAKVKQDVAKYQEQPKDGHQCSGCQQFVAPDSCKLVDGKINPNGWCQFFSPKSS